VGEALQPFRTGFFVVVQHAALGLLTLRAVDS
jgi:hypothetical protein